MLVEIVVWCCGRHVPAPIDSGIDKHQNKLRADLQARVHETPNGGAMPPGYFGRDDRRGIVRVAA